MRTSMKKNVRPDCRKCRYRDKKKCTWFGDEIDYKTELIVCEAYVNSRASTSEGEQEE